MNNLKAILAQKKKRQKWLAAQLGVCQDTVSNWVTGKTGPTLRMACLICDLLDIDITELYNPAGAKDGDNGHG